MQNRVIPTFAQTLNIIFSFVDVKFHLGCNPFAHIWEQIQRNSVISTFKQGCLRLDCWFLLESVLMAIFQFPKPGTDDTIEM